MSEELEFTGYNFPEVWKFTSGYARAEYQDDYCPVCYIDTIVDSIAIRPGDVLKRLGRNIIIDRK